MIIDALNKFAFAWCQITFLQLIPCFTSKIYAAAHCQTFMVDKVELNCHLDVDINFARIICYFKVCIALSSNSKFILTFLYLLGQIGFACHELSDFIPCVWVEQENNFCAHKQCASLACVCTNNKDFAWLLISICINFNFKLSMAAT